MAEFLNKNVKHLRIINGFSQQELADKVAIDRSTISRIENGEIETTVDNAVKLADALNVSLSDLLGKDLTKENNINFDEVEILFDKNKKILTEDDKEMIRFIIEKRKKEVDKQLGFDSE